MTNDELHSKCQQAQERIYNTLHITSSSFWMDTLKANLILESLYREAMAAGLERAFEEFQSDTGRYCRSTRGSSMTNEQIRERCKAFLLKTGTKVDGSSGGLVITGGPTIETTESLYREAMAAGLEMAAVLNEELYDASHDREAVFYEALLTGAAQCRAEAQRVKEGM